MDSDKRSLRQAAREAAKKLTKEEIAAASHAMAVALFASKEYQSAESIFLYLSMPTEPATSEIFARADADGKRIYVPKCVGLHEMMAVRCRVGDALITDAHGIREPVWIKEIAAPEALDLILVPCLAAGRDGSRLGHGGGYYDAFLARTTGYQLCLCFDALLREDIPMEAHDIRMDAVLTESGILPAKADLESRKA